MDSTQGWKRPAVAKGGRRKTRPSAGEHVRDRGLDGLLATRAVVAVDDMFHAFRTDIFGPILDDARAGGVLALAGVDGSTAMGTGLQVALDVPVDVRGQGTPRSGMAFFPAGLLFPA